MAKPRVPAFSVTTGQAPPRSVKVRDYRTLTVRVPMVMHRAWSIRRATRDQDFQDFVLEKMEETLVAEKFLKPDWKD